MNRAEAISRLRENAGAIRGMGATALYMFGSTARDEAKPQSDLDLFIDYDKSGRFSLLDLVGIKQELENELGVGVDIATRDSLHPRLKSDIEQHAIRIF